MEQVYFASDFHLGLDARVSSAEREKQIVRWLDRIGNDATHIMLVGDLFDFWYEYRSVVPKGSVRFLGKLAELADRGISIEAFSGNHDTWLKTYLTDEIGVPVHHAPITRTFGGKKFLIGHGDGLGPGDHGYKVLKRIFRSPISQWLFSRVHPNFAFALARYWSAKSRSGAPHRDRFSGRENEWLVQYCEELLQQTSYDYFIFGHRHLPIRCALHNEQSIYINLGDWLQYNSYAYFDGHDLQLDFFENDDHEILEL